MKKIIIFVLLFGAINIANSQSFIKETFTLNNFQPNPIESLSAANYSLDGTGLDLKSAKKKGGLLAKLDKPLFSVLKEKVDQLDTILRPQFLDDFADASRRDLKKLQDKNLFDAWKDNVRSTDFDVLATSIENSNLRNEYHDLVSALADKKISLLDEGKSMEEVARTLFTERRRLTIHYKHITPPEFLKWIFKRNEITYTKTDKGDEWGATFDGLFNSKLKKMAKMDSTVTKATATEAQLNKIYESIANSSSRTSGATKQQLGDNFYLFFKDKISATELAEFEKVLKKYRMR